MKTAFMLSNGKCRRKYDKTRLEPQVRQVQIVILHRYYVKHTGEDSYEKGVSWVESTSQQVACCEYKGQRHPAKPQREIQMSMHVRMNPKNMDKNEERTMKQLISSMLTLTMRDRKISNNLHNAKASDLREQYIFYANIFFMPTLPTTYVVRRNYKSPYCSFNRSQDIVRLVI